MNEISVPIPKKSSFSSLDFPKVKWQADFWLAVIPFVIGIIAFVFPNISNSEIYKTYRMPIAVILLLSPLIIPISLWSVRCLFVVFARSKKYPLVLNELTNVASDLQEIKQNIYELVAKISNQKVFEISSAVYQGKLYLTIPKGRSKLNQGDMVVVVHTEDAMTMGFLKLFKREMWII